ncbi:MAG: dockerin type I repeat-containing protein [Myxococcota bacterium]
MIKVIGNVLLTAGVMLFAGSAVAQSCPVTDLNGDGTTDVADVEVFQAAMGSEEGDENFLAAADLDGNGTVTASDFGILLSCN